MIIWPGVSLCCCLFKGNKIPTPIWNPIPDIPCSVQACTVTEGRLSFLFPPVRLLLHQLRGEKKHCPKYFHTAQHPDRRGQRFLSAQRIYVFRLRPLGTRVHPSLKLHLMTGSSPRWCTGCPVPGISPPSRSLFPPLSWTAQKN